MFRVSRSPPEGLERAAGSFEFTSVSNCPFLLAGTFSVLQNPFCRRCRFVLSCGLNSLFYSDAWLALLVVFAHFPPTNGKEPHLLFCLCNVTPASNSGACL